MSGPTWQERLFAKAAPDANGCWIWTGSHNWDGYGLFTGPGRKLSTAHRWAYVAAHGSVSPELQVDHLCRVRDCINPAHLEEVTVSENLRRRPLKTHCKNGHEFTAENTRTTSNGNRQCITCKRAYELAAHYAGKRKRYPARAEGRAA